MQCEVCVTFSDRRDGSSGAKPTSDLTDLNEYNEDLSMHRKVDKHICAVLFSPRACLLLVAVVALYTVYTS